MKKRATPFPLKDCPVCGNAMERRYWATNKESERAYNARKTCSHECGCKLRELTRKETGPRPYQKPSSPIDQFIL